MQKPVCCICGSKKFLKLHYKELEFWEYSGKFSYLSCQRCGLILQSPRVEEKYVFKYYSKPEYFGEWFKNIKNSSQLKKLADRTYSFIYRDLLAFKRQGRILDVGSGSGLFLFGLKLMGWQVEGVEISRTACRLSQKYLNIKPKIGNFLKMKFKPETFDTVTMLHVLEHVYEPCEYIRKIYKLLKDDGILIIVVPNIASLGSKIFKRNWYALQPGRHLYHFNYSSIKKILELEGFSIIKTRYDYFIHNYWTLFESFRLRFSQKFRTAKKKSNHARKNDQSKIVKDLGKIILKINSYILAKVESKIKMGETITIYARKA